MEATSHVSAPVELAAALVNALTAGERGGQPYDQPGDDRLPALVAEVMQDRPNRARAWAAADADAHRRLRALAGRWREVFAVADDTARAAPLVNDLLDDAPVRPRLVDHDDEPWHLHAHGDDVDPVDAIAATCALGLATLVTTDGTTRLGVCAARACDRVYVDTSRNASRRYCSTACQARAKTAAFRARRS